MYKERRGGMKSLEHSISWACTISGYFASIYLHINHGRAMRLFIPKCERVYL